MIGVLRIRGEDQTDDRRTDIRLAFWRIDPNGELEYMTLGGTTLLARRFQYVDHA